MNIQDRSYSGKLFRPTPEVLINNDKDLFIMATPWGNPEAAKDFINLISTQYQTGLDDPDRTQSSQLDFLSREENSLRLSIITAHEDIREKYNDDTVSAGLEILCCIKVDKTISWFVIGAPAIALRRTDKLVPLHHPVDLSFDFSKEKTLAPLPKNLLGLQSTLNLSHGNFRLQDNDELLLISRSYIPHSLFTMPVSDLHIESATLAMAKDNEDVPFWIGALKFG